MNFDEVENFLADEIFKIDSMFSMYFSIHNSTAEYLSVMNLASAFFQATKLALLENSTLRLCKLYDKDIKAVTIQKYLRTAASDPMCLSGSRDELNSEVTLCEGLITAEEPRIAKLRQLRDSFLAHNDSRMLNVDPFAEVGLTIGEYRSLFVLAGTIINRIRKVCNRRHILFKLVDDDDYKYILIGLSEYIKEHPDFFDKVQKEKDAREKKIVSRAIREL